MAPGAWSLNWDRGLLERQNESMGSSRQKWFPPSYLFARNLSSSGPVSNSSKNSCSRAAHANKLPFRAKDKFLGQLPRTVATQITYLHVIFILECTYSSKKREDILSFRRENAQNNVACFTLNRPMHMYTSWSCGILNICFITLLTRQGLDRKKHR
jgi:hypothetical protein